MVAFADFDAFQGFIRSNAFVFPVLSAGPTGDNGIWRSAFTTAPTVGIAPTTAAACDRTLVGALSLPNRSESMYIVEARFDGNQAVGGGIGGMLIDRLSHQGGLNATVATEQTTNLPTAALTRYTDGVGVHAALEIYSAIGATATTATLNYTNQAGTSGRTSEPVVIGSTAVDAASDFLVVSLQAGDTGVRSVQGVTLAATTGTAGNFGVTLFRPLWLPRVSQQAAEDFEVFNPLLGGAGWMPVINPNACLHMLECVFQTTASTIQGWVKYGLA